MAGTPGLSNYPSGPQNADISCANSADISCVNDSTFLGGYELLKDYLEDFATPPLRPKFTQENTLPN